PPDPLASTAHARPRPRYPPPVRFSSPFDIQAFLDDTAYSDESIYRCPARVLVDRRAHCVDGALLAAAALRRLGEPPLVTAPRARSRSRRCPAPRRRRGPPRPRRPAPARRAPAGPRPAGAPRRRPPDRPPPPPRLLGRRRQEQRRRPALARARLPLAARARPE